VSGARPRLQLRGFRFPGADGVGTADLVLLPAAGGDGAQPLPFPVHFRAGAFQESPAGFKTWGWDGDLKAPTLAPSILCRMQIPGAAVALFAGWEPHRGEHLVVHFHLQRGRVVLCPDATVALEPTDRP
jgi:hypothetical protein